MVMSYLVMVLLGIFMVLLAIRHQQYWKNSGKLSRLRLRVSNRISIQQSIIER